MALCGHPVRNPCLTLIQFKRCQHGWCAASVLVSSSSHLYSHFEVELHRRLCTVELLLCSPDEAAGTSSLQAQSCLLYCPDQFSLVWSYETGVRSWSDICIGRRMCELLNMYFVAFIDFLCVDADGSVVGFSWCELLVHTLIWGLVCLLWIVVI